jgi:hypothetical protein
VIGKGNEAMSKGHSASRLGDRVGATAAASAGNGSSIQGGKHGSRQCVP